VLQLLDHLPGLYQKNPFAFAEAAAPSRKLPPSSTIAVTREWKTSLICPGNLAFTLSFLVAHLALT